METNRKGGESRSGAQGTERDLTWSLDAVVVDDDDDQLLTCCCSFCPGTRNPRPSSVGRPPSESYDRLVYWKGISRKFALLEDVFSFCLCPLIRGP